MVGNAVRRKSANVLFLMLIDAACQIVVMPFFMVMERLHPDRVAPVVLEIHSKPVEGQAQLKSSAMEIYLTPSGPRRSSL